MYIVDEKDREYRFGDSGPKYLMKGPRMNFALVQFMPGQDFRAHYHNVMEEDFFILEGEIDIEPGEVHYCKNNCHQPVKMVSTLAPYEEVDKVEVDNPVC